LAAIAIVVTTGAALAYARLAPAEVEGPQCDPLDPAVG